LTVATVASYAWAVCPMGGYPEALQMPL
jgi:hypothetical protein